MTQNANGVSLKKSKRFTELNGVKFPNLPSADKLVEGELAINYAEGLETISTKNESGDVVTFSSDDYYTAKKLGDYFTGENSAKTVTEVMIQKERVTAEAIIDLDNKKADYDEILWYKGTAKGAIKQDEGAIASGVSSLSEGIGKAYGSYSHAEGRMAIASGFCSHAEGDSTYAGNSNSHAEGELTIATGQISHAEGYNSIASGYTSHAEGDHAKAYGSSSHAEGSGTSATSIASHAEGGLTLAGGDYADYTHAEGYKTSATTHFAHAEGSGTSASNTAAHAEGVDTVASGMYSHAEGDGTSGMGYYCHAEGGFTKVGANTYGAHAEGAWTVANGSRAHAEGERTSAMTNNSHSEGYKTMASGAAAHAEGYLTLASYNNSHAEGESTSATSQASHAEGFYTKAYRTGSHAEGQSTQAIGDLGSHAEGNGTIASGISTHAEGHYTQAFGDYSHAEGFQTKALNRSEHSCGQNNISSSASTTFGHSGNTLFSVGNGSNTIPHNAFEIRQNGDIYIVNKDGNDVKLQDEIGNITVDQVIDETTSASTNPVSTSGVYGFVTSYTPSITVDQVINETTSGSSNPVSTKAVYSAITDNEMVWANAYVTISGAISSHTEDTDVHVTAADKTAWNAAATDSHTHSNKSALDAITGSVGTMAYENASSYSSATQVNTALGGKADTGHTHDASGITAMTGYQVASSSASVLTTDTLLQTIGKLEKRIELLEAALGGMTLVKLTSQQYADLAVKDPNTMYIIND